MRIEITGAFIASMPEELKKEHMQKDAKFLITLDGVVVAHPAYAPMIFDFRTGKWRSMPHLEVKTICK